MANQWCMFKHRLSGIVTRKPWRLHCTEIYMVSRALDSKTWFKSKPCSETALWPSENYLIFLHINSVTRGKRQEHSSCRGLWCLNGIVDARLIRYSGHAEIFIFILFPNLTNLYVCFKSLTHWPKLTMNMPFLKAKRGYGGNRGIMGKMQTEY